MVPEVSMVWDRLPRVTSARVTLKGASRSSRHDGSADSKSGRRCRSTTETIEAQSKAGKADRIRILMAFLQGSEGRGQKPSLALRANHSLWVRSRASGPGRFG